ncbi:MAG: OmpA family protein [Rhodobacteraceae bacterium]|jgi:OOP family OmpA-OmpF porin|nr:OmpA family protein [Paracoccaceae bacterium]
MIRRFGNAPALAVRLGAFALALLVALVAATFAVDAIERRTHAGIVRALAVEGLADWSSVTVDGLRVELAGTAPDEGARFAALAAAGRVVDAQRLTDTMQVAAGPDVPPPEFSLEILRNDGGVSLIGLVPGATDRDALIARAADIAGDDRVADFLQRVDHDAPPVWQATLDYTLAALERLPRSKISASPGVVRITAITDSAAEQRRLETDLARSAPDGVRVFLDISAPRPVITPFTLRFVAEPGRMRFDACSADTEEARTAILAAAAEAGMTGQIGCRIGLGAPTPRWAEGAVAAVRAAAALGNAAATISDTEVRLVAEATVDQAAFDRAAANLRAALPESFSLTAILREPADATADGPATLSATLSATSEEGLRLDLSGRVSDERARTVVTSFAEARFGIGRVFDNLELDETLPEIWTLQAMAALESLALLDEGQVALSPEGVALSGLTGNPAASDEAARILSARLGADARLDLAVTYEESRDPSAALPSPDQCALRLNTVMGETKLTFEPGSATLDVAGTEVLGRLAEIMRDCGHVPMEVAGHTDSQGREEMNLALSQSRADAVLTALMARRVLTTNLTARGYGETTPIADNGTEAGREANRRIEFRVLVSDGALPVAAAAPEEEDGAALDGGGTAEAGRVAVTLPELASRPPPPPPLSGRTDAVVTRAAGAEDDDDGPGAPEVAVDGSGDGSADGQGTDGGVTSGAVTSGEADGASE